MGELLNDRDNAKTKNVVLSQVALGTAGRMRIGRALDQRAGAGVDYRFRTIATPSGTGSA